MEDIKIKDNFSGFVNAKIPNIMDYNLMSELILFSLIALTYYNGNFELYIKIIKFMIIIFIIRYIFNTLTNYRENGKKKNLFQLNSILALFAIIILSNNLNLNNWTVLSILIGYTLFLSATKNGYTVNNILTILIVYNLINSKIV